MVGFRGFLDSFWLVSIPLWKGNYIFKFLDFAIKGPMKHTNGTLTPPSPLKGEGDKCPFSLEGRRLG